MSNELILSLGWTLLHSLWQVGLLGLCTLGLERLLRSYSAQLRHQQLLLMLGVTVLVCAITLLQEWQHFTQIRYLLMNTKEGAGQTNLNILQLNPSSLLSPAPLPLLWRCKIWVDDHLFWLVMLWMSGMLYFSLRFGRNYWALQRLRKQSVVLQEPQLLALIEKIQRSLGLKKRGRFYIHPSLSSPLTFGHFRPVILLPAALLCQTPPDLLEALLRHELIHIRRADFLINLLMSAIQILFFYHPMIWMLTRRIQELREEACDEAVLQSGCNKLVYAEALLHLQRLHHHQNIPLVMQAQNQPSHFGRRVQQILERPLPTSISRRNHFWSAALPIILIGVLFVFDGFKPTNSREKKERASLEMPKPQANTTEPTKSTAILIQSPKNASNQMTIQATIPETGSVEPIITLSIDSLPQSANDMVLSVAAERMNVLYMGIDNPISVALSGIPAEQLNVSSKHANIRLSPVGKGKYIAKVAAPGIGTIIVEAPNYKQEVEFRLKVIPDPIAVLPNSLQKDGEISLSKARGLKNIELFIPVDFETGCKVLGFNMIYVSKEKNPTQVPNPGGLFIPAALNLMQNINENDFIIFDNIRAKCQGDEAGRKINNMSFKIVADPEKKE